jgi:2-polyprenyl-3-methyl-5-hydroxy-6-metoxy-1,4-benzoquinol methylase
VEKTLGYDARRYWDLRLDKHWSLRGVGMLRLGHSWNRWQYRVRRVVFRHIVRSLDVDLSTAKVLDIGSGVGFYINLWRQAGAANVTGVDIADSAVRRLSECLPGIRFERLDISGDVGHLGGNYDAVSAMDVLFHIVNDDLYERAFANVYNLLRPGGWFIFSEHLPCTVPNLVSRR